MSVGSTPYARAMPNAEEYEAAGLYDPTDPAHETRVELLDWLVEQGYSIAEMQHADSVDALVALPGDRRLLSGRLLTRDDAVRRTRLSPEEFDAYSTAFGFLPVDGAPRGEVGYTEAEVATIAMVAGLGSMFSESEALAFTRVVGSALGRIAEAGVSLFLADIEMPHLESGATELELAHKVAEAIGLIDGLTADLDPILRRQLKQAAERTRRTTVGPAERVEYRFAVGFVDLVGFTAVSGDMDPRELASFMGRFEGRAHDIATELGARIVKLIGDAVMLVATDAADACRAGLALMDALAGDDDRVVPRGGMAYGNVVLRGGDYFGTTVNVASRLADGAVPHELLVTEELAAAAPSCDFEPAGRRMLKGFPDPVRVSALLR